MQKFQFARLIPCVIVTIVAIAATGFGQADQKTATKHDNYIEAVGKVLTVDPIKGDVTVRVEFFPHGNLMNEDGSLAKNVKFDTVSSNGKQEITFEKGKRISPTELVLNMYDGYVEDYPFDNHKANIVFFFTVKPEKEKPKDAAENEEQPKPESEAAEESEVEVPFTFDFTPASPGYSITTTKSKDSDDSFIDLEMTIKRSAMVKVFSIFVSLLMVLVTLAVVIFVFTVIRQDRKVEIAMFSFITTLLFAFVAVRGAQPAVPPVGILTDYLSFFWAEVVLALCLLTIVFTWILRPAK